MATKKKRKKPKSTKRVLHTEQHAQKHVHRECSHKEISYCKKCDAVYCKAKDCHKEWKYAPCGLNHPWTYTTAYPATTTTGIYTSGGVSGGALGSAFSLQAGSASANASANLPSATFTVDVDHTSHDAEPVTVQ